MKRLILSLLILAVCSQAQVSRRNSQTVGNKPLCAGIITTNCIPSADGSSVVILPGALTVPGAITSAGSTVVTLADTAIPRWNKYTVTKIANNGTTCATGSIGAGVFTGTGVDDDTYGGTYTGAAAATFTVVIDGAAEPDTFKWQKDAGAWTETVAITGAAQTLSDGVTIAFAATTGHTATDQWVSTVTVTGCWQVGTGTPVAAEGDLSQDIVLFQLPAKGNVEHGRLKTSTAYTGATTAVATVGTASDTDLYLITASAYDLAAAVAATNISSFAPSAGAKTHAAENVVLNITTTEANVSALATGSAVDVWLLWSVLP